FKTKINRVLFDIKNKEFLSPTLIVVGKTIGLSDDLNYFERRPLFNKNVLITRSFKDSLILSERLKNLGANVINAPTFTIEPINLDILEKDIDNFSYDYLIFTSVNSVRIFFETLLKKYDIRKIGNVKIAAIGSKCKEVIEKYNLKVSFYSREGVAEKLYEKLFSIMRKEDRVYLPHSSLTRAYIIKKMKEKSNLRELTIYDNKIVREKVKFRGKIDLALFMSSSSVNNFIEVYGKEALDGAKIFSIGNITTQTLKNKGIGEILQADIASSESLLERIEEYYEDEKN
ncbi:MAG: uroporphyrinogen-III synthase, partial [Anaerococcus sp.]|nr:uroporphyrinogen-III synthase [Anaerococcus sp.]